MLTAIKPVFDRRTQTFSVSVVRKENDGETVLLAHLGYLVFDSPERALAGVKNGTLAKTWPLRKRLAVIAWLEAAVDGSCGAATVG